MAIMRLGAGGGPPSHRQAHGRCSGRSSCRRRSTHGMNAITVQHLLQHTGGWNRDITFDPMFYDQTIAAYYGAALPISRQQIMNYMTATKMLSFAPGTQMNYSNYGYLLLGRIIEKVTGMTYADYVQSKILAPLGISRMVQGATELEYRPGRRGAVLHAGPEPVPERPPRGRPDKRRDRLWQLQPREHGLARRVAGIGGGPGLLCHRLRPDRPLNPVLTRVSVDRTFAVPSIGANPDGSWYGCGWAARTAGTGLNTWHNGSLPGTSTLMVRRYDGLDWVVLFNQRDDPSGLNYGDIDGALHTAANAVTTWPDGDLFPTYGVASHVLSFTDDPMVPGGHAGQERAHQRTASRDRRGSREARSGAVLVLGNDCARHDGEGLPRVRTPNGAGGRVFDGRPVRADVHRPTTRRRQADQSRAHHRTSRCRAGDPVMPGGVILLESPRAHSPPRGCSEWRGSRTRRPPRYRRARRSIGAASPRALCRRVFTASSPRPRPSASLGGAEPPRRRAARRPCGTRLVARRPACSRIARSSAAYVSRSGSGRVDVMVSMDLSRSLPMLRRSSATATDCCSLSAASRTPRSG